MRKKNLVAVVNDELMMVSKEVMNCLTDEEFDTHVKALSDAITKHVTNDDPFVKAVGENVAKKCCFEVLPVCDHCPDCGELQFLMRVVMRVGNKETDFFYDYYLVANPVVSGVEDAPLVLYTNGGKSQLMKVFESVSNGVTSVKSFKNGRGKNDADDYLERIYAEILSETDLKVF